MTHTPHRELLRYVRTAWCRCRFAYFRAYYFTFEHPVLYVLFQVVVLAICIPFWFLRALAIELLHGFPVLYIPYILYLLIFRPRRRR